MYIVELYVCDSMCICECDLYDLEFQFHLREQEKKINKQSTMAWMIIVWNCEWQDVEMIYILNVYMRPYLAAGIVYWVINLSSIVFHTHSTSPF